MALAQAPGSERPLGKEALLYRRLPSGKVQCLACSRYCQIGEGQVGLCGIRGVANGRLYLYVYGRVITGQIDPIEKKPVVHYRPGSKIFSVATTGCNWLCHPAGTEVLLADGSSKRVEELVPGDVLWSYDMAGGLRPSASVVTHVGRRVARLWEIRYASGEGGSLILTAEHPVLTRNGWRAASELVPGDLLLEVLVHEGGRVGNNRAPALSGARFSCGACGGELVGLEEWERHRARCYRRAMGEAWEALEPMAMQPLAYPGHAQAWALDGAGVPRAKPSDIRLHELLESLGLAYERRYRIEVKKGPGSGACYIAEAAVPDARLVIEVGLEGGPGPEEAARDEALRSNGWRVLRIPSRYLFLHPEEVKALIAHALSSPPMADERRWAIVESARPLERFEEVYSLECIPHRNYIADGVAVHNCAYCQNFDISQRRKVEGIEVEPDELVAMALRYRCQGLAYTYNEPTIFIEWARDIGLEARRRGLFNIFVTNGYETPEAVGLMKEFLDCATVDFKGNGEPSFVRRYIGIEGPEPIFQTLLEIKNRTSIHLEVTDLVVPEVGDDLEAARKLARWIYDNLGPDTPLHFLRFHPDYRLLHLPYTPIETLEAHYRVAKEEGLNYVYIGNVPGHPAESTYCPGCGAVVVKRRGYYILGWGLDEQNRCKACGHRIPIVGRLEPTAGEFRFLPVLS